MKKAWSKPQLVVLHRGKEEAVLALCMMVSPKPGPTTGYASACYNLGIPCTVCESQSGS